jgi:hypothetical protein
MFHRSTLAASRMLLAGMLVHGACTAQGPAPDLRHSVADYYGFANFDEVAALRFTWNVQRSDMRTSRSWVWEPKTDRVTFTPAAPGEGPTTYERTADPAALPEALRKIDAGFINDQYWLLFPFHLVWDKMATVTRQPGQKPLPIGQGEASEILVKYPSTGGYTPGDEYELFVDPNGRILQWIYRRSGAPQPTLTAAWEDYQRIGPLNLSLNRPGPTADFRVWFTDVAVQLVGQTGWITAR